ncbi:MAG: OsmC family protein [Acidaminococcaceae bacterium]
MITVHNKATNFLMELSNGTTTILSDVPADHGGGGEYFAPFNLLCASFAACLEATTRIILNQRGIAYNAVSVKVDLKPEVTDQTVFVYDITIDSDLSTAETAKLVKMAFAGCPIHKALSKEIVFEKM